MRPPPTLYGGAGARAVVSSAFIERPSGEANLAQLDIGRTAFAGLGVIGRNGFAPLVWGLVQTVLAFVPLLLIVPTMGEYLSLIMASGGDLDPQNPELLRLANQMNVIQPISWICQLAAHGLVTGAIFRAVLHPEDKRWFFMRLGMGELMLIAVSLVYLIITVVAVVVAAIVVAIVGFAIGAANETAGITAAVVVGLIVLGVLIWASLRFSLGFAMSHDRKQFLLFESWRMTRGHAGGLFGAGLLAVIVGWLISVAVMLVLIVVAVAIFFGSGGPALFESLQNVDAPGDVFSQLFTPERTPVLIAFGALYVFAVTVIQGYVGTIFTAPWAEAYRQLALPSEEVF